jgi:hypothetical protein
MKTRYVERVFRETLARDFLFLQNKMPALRLGNTAPNFDAQTTAGPINFHQWIGDSWVGSHQAPLPSGFI